MRDLILPFKEVNGMVIDTDVTNIVCDFHMGYFPPNIMISFKISCIHQENWVFLLIFYR